VLQTERGNAVGLAGRSRASVETLPLSGDDSRRTAVSIDVRPSVSETQPALSRRHRKGP